MHLLTLSHCLSLTLSLSLTPTLQVAESAGAAASIAVEEPKTGGEEGGMDEEVEEEAEHPSGFKVMENRVAELQCMTRCIPGWVIKLQSSKNSSEGKVRDTLQRVLCSNPAYLLPALTCWALVNRTQARVNRTQALVNRTQGCVNLTQGCVNLTQACVNCTQALVNRTQVRANRTQALVNRTQALVCAHAGGRRLAQQPAHVRRADLHRRHATPDGCRAL